MNVATIIPLMSNKKNEQNYRGTNASKMLNRNITAEGLRDSSGNTFMNTAKRVNKRL